MSLYGRKQKSKQAGQDSSTNGAWIDSNSWYLWNDWAEEGLGMAKGRGKPSVQGGHWPHFSEEQAGCRVSEKGQAMHPHTSGTLQISWYVWSVFEMFF